MLLSLSHAGKPCFVCCGTRNDREADAVHRLNGEVWHVVGPIVQGETFRMPSWTSIDRTVDCTGDAVNTRRRVEEALDACALEMNTTGENHDD